MSGPNRRARRNAKIRKSKSLVHEPNGNNQGDKSQQSEDRPVLAPILGDTPASASQSEKSNTANPAQPSPPVMRFLVTVRVAFRWMFGILDKHNGSVMAIATIAIVALTASYVGYSKKQWQSMEESNTISRDALQSVQRAFVSFSGFTSRRDKQGSRFIWEFLPNIENSGATPVPIAVSSSDSGSFRDLTEQVFIGKDAAHSKEKWRQSTIGPKGSVSISTQRVEEAYLFGTDLGDDYINAAKAKLRNDYYVWGWIAYTDVFRSRKAGRNEAQGTNIHLTEFCRRLEPVFGIVPGPPRNIIMTYDYCPEHNCVDEYCADYAEVMKIIPPL